MVFPSTARMTIFVILAIIALLFLGSLIAGNNSALLSEKLSKVVLKNQVKAEVDQNKLKLLFVLDEASKNRLNIFSDRLGITSQWTDGVTINLDQQSADFLKIYLPIQSQFYFEDNRLEIIGKGQFGFFDPTGSSSEYHFDAGSGNLVIKTDGKGDINFMIKDPEIVVRQAEKQDKIQISANLGDFGLWQLLSKLDTINGDLGKGSFSATIILK